MFPYIICMISIVMLEPPDANLKISDGIIAATSLDVTFPYIVTVSSCLESIGTLVASG